MGGTGWSTARRYAKGMKNPKNWQIMEYQGDIILARLIPSNRILSGYIGRLLVSHKNGSLRMKLSPYVNFYNGDDKNLAIMEISDGERRGIPRIKKDEDYKSVKKSLIIKAKDIGKKINIENLSKF